jgi:hypothetical protein
MNDGDLADFLAECGAVVGGSTALAGALGLLVGSAVRDLSARSPHARARGWHTTDPVAWATRVAPYGGVLGVAALVFRWAGVD